MSERLTNLQAAYDAVFDEGPVSRNRLTRRLGLATPTVSSLIGELESVGLIHEAGSEKPARGRAAQLYAIVPAARLVIGVHLGSTRIAAAVGDLRGEVLHELREPTAHDGGDALVAQLEALCDKLAAAGGGPLAVAAVAAPGVVLPSGAAFALAPSVPALERLPLADRLSASLRLPVILENDVNAETMGERARGHARGVSDVVFLHIGMGVGMGLILDGRLRRGAHGAAGEVGFLPIGGDHEPVDDRVGLFERAVGARALLERYAVRTGERLAGSDALVQRAEADDPDALAVIDDAAAIVDLGVRAVQAVVDPELVVIGGSLANAEALVEGVRRRAGRADASEVQVARSALGGRAGLFGAVAIAAQRARRQLFEQWQRTAAAP